MSQRQQALLIFYIALAVSALTWCSVTANATNAPQLVSGVIIADASVKDVDPAFWYQFCIAILVVGGVADKVISWRRKPSVDVDFKEHGTRLNNTEGSVRLLFKKLDQITDTLSRLSVAQGTNTANITDIQTTVHDLKQAIALNEQSRTQQFAALNARIDRLHEANR